jgi:hypothetical protein
VRRWALDADRVGWRRARTERLIGWAVRHGVDDLQIVHGRGDRLSPLLTNRPQNVITPEMY